jgi:spoIIIJ-associated protein
MDKQLETIKILAEELLHQLLIKGEIVVNFDETGAIFKVKIETEDSGFLIGYHGETLAAFQLILSLMVYRKTDEWVKLAVNVGDYREKREDQLTRLALSVAQKVSFTKEAQAIPRLSAGERRIIHMALAERPDVFSESEGEGDERILVIKPKV